MPRFDRLFLAEKASVGKTFAEFLAKKTGAELQMQRQYARVGNDVIAWLSGHLFEQVYPEGYNPAFKFWHLEHLPIIPDRFKIEAKPDQVGKVETIKGLLADCTTVVGYGDPDAEGQLLQDELLLELGNTKPVLRMWASSLDDKSLETALANLKPNSEYIGWYESALSRQQADWLYGLNMTRACTLHSRAAGAPPKSVVYIGRVQTPALALVVRRELEIRNFKPVDYYVPYIDLATAPGVRGGWLVTKDADGAYQDERVDHEGRLTSKSKADAIVAGAKASGKAVVVTAETKAGTESAPLPFALASLQAHCSKLFGLGAKDTLDIAQALYLKKVTTYPRVDCEYLPLAQHADAARILKSLGKAALPEVLAKAIAGVDATLKSKTWNDSKVTAHHAIIPAHLDNPADVGTLSDIELKVYCEIVKRYTLQFWPAAKFNATTLVFECAGERYGANGRVYTDEGWRKAFAGGQEKDAAPGLPALKKGQELAVSDAGTDAKRTTPPKRFEDGAFGQVMKSIHQFIEDPEVKKRLKEGAGIGTDATRASIIEGLLTKKLLQKDGKFLYPSDDAIKLIQLLPKEMTAPDLTAEWQERNDAVLARRSTHADFMAQLRPWLCDLVARSSTFFRPEHFPGGTPREPQSERVQWQVTEHTCFGSFEKEGCGSPLKHIPGKFGMFFGCTNAECKKTFRDVDGKPAEKAPAAAPRALDKTYACVSCNDPEQGFLRRLERKDKTGFFWGCANWKAGCKGSANDVDGKPVAKQPAKAAA
jgi:DNA topoisomerase-3